jgi:hypothetical protein
MVMVSCKQMVCRILEVLMQQMEDQALERVLSEFKEKACPH